MRKPTSLGLPALHPTPKLGSVGHYANFLAIELEAAGPAPLFFHHEGNRALRLGDWKIVSARIDGDRWSLYNLVKDRAESTDLAARYPERLREMSARWQEMEDTFRRQAGTTNTPPAPALPLR